MADEAETLDRSLDVKPLVPFGARWRRKQADLFVVSVGLHLAARRPGHAANGERAPYYHILLEATVTVDSTYDGNRCNEEHWRSSCPPTAAITNPNSTVPGRGFAALCSRNDAIGNVAVMLAAGGVFITGTAWPDLVVAGVMVGLFLWSSVQIIVQALNERRHTADAVAAE